MEIKLFKKKVIFRDYEGRETRFTRYSFQLRVDGVEQTYDTCRLTGKSLKKLKDYLQKYWNYQTFKVIDTGSIVERPPYWQ
jgi:hypothetical protein